MKDYLKLLFSFSRKELNGLLVLIGLLLLLLAARWLTGWLMPRPEVDFTDFEREIAMLQADALNSRGTDSAASAGAGMSGLPRADLSGSPHPDATVADATVPDAMAPDAMARDATVADVTARGEVVPSGVPNGRNSAELVLPDTASLFRFDPNTVSRAGLLKLGLRPRVAGVLMNFREAGGKFYKKEDLAKIYGLREELYKRLRPYIVIPGAGRARDPDDGRRTGDRADTWKEALKNTEGAAGCSPVEINGASAADLLPLRGIGPVLSERIVKYRERLGGFHSAGQLLEVYGMDTAAFNGFRKCLRVDSAGLEKININRAGFAELSRLPYWSPAQVNVVLNYREQHGPFSGVNALYNIRALEEHTIQKVIPYLKVNQNQSKK